MSQKQFFLTPEGLTKLVAELEHLRSVHRPEVARRIKQAKELGSAENNAEYDDAKNERAFIEGRILTLENMIKNATVIQAEASPPSLVKLGSKVTVCNQDGEVEHYIIVGSVEANPAEGKISNESPVGRALLERKVGDEVEVQVPSGVLKLRVTEIR